MISDELLKSATGRRLCGNPVHILLASALAGFCKKLRPGTPNSSFFEATSAHLRVSIHTSSSVLFKIPSPDLLHQPRRLSFEGIRRSTYPKGLELACVSYEVVASSFFGVGSLISPCACQ